MPENWQIAEFGLYIHWPFCAAKCPYCDFNSHVSAQIDQNRWARAYLSEIDRIGTETKGRVLSSVFFGGGTPSLMDPDLVGTILQRVRATWALANNVEITLEANPTSVEAGRFKGYQEAGVNRVSLGVQALNDRDLKALGRLHSTAEAFAALDVARSVFNRVSFDLIYARQHQSLADWDDELRRALAFDPHHLSLYQLTIEDGTAFGDRHRRGRLAGLPSEDLGADLFERTQSLCNAAGLPAYEVSNHASSGEESRHNLVYWQAGDYAGIGPGAHGRLSVGDARFATETRLSPAEWLSDVESTGSGEHVRYRQTTPEIDTEILMMGLRLQCGVPLGRLRNPLKSNNISGLRDSGLIETSSNNLIVTPRGRPVLNAILRELLPG